MIEKLSSDLEAKDKEIRELQESVRETEDAFKSKQRADATWDLMYQKDRAKLQQLEHQVAKLKKENCEVPVLRQQLAHAQRVALESASEAKKMTEQSLTALATMQEAEVNMQECKQVRANLRSEENAYHCTKKTLDAERAAKDVLELRLNEATKTEEKQKQDLHELGDNLRAVEHRLVQAEMHRDLVVGEITEEKEKSRQSSEETAKVQKQSALLLSRNDELKQTVESHAREVQRLQRDYHAHMILREQFTHMEEQKDGALRSLKELKKSADKAKETLVKCELQESKAIQDSAYAKECVAELQEAEKKYVKEGQEMIMKLSGAEEYSKYMAERVEELKNELSQEEKVSEKNLAATKKAALALSKYEEKKRHRTHRGTSPFRDEMVAQLVEDREYLGKKLESLSKEKDTIRSQGKKTIDRLNTKIAKMTAAHDDLRSLYREHLDCVNERYSKIVAAWGERRKHQGA